MQTATQVEDLDAVLSRFQSWSESRKPKRKAKDLPEGVRELSYDEALQSSRYRWQARMQPQEDETAKEVQGDSDRPLAPAETGFGAEAILPDKVSLGADIGRTDSEQEARELVAELDKEPAAEPVIPSFGSVLGGTVLAGMVFAGRGRAEAVLPEPDPGSMALVWPAADRAERQVSMSLRVAASEQALIKARAAEAGLSVSAYLRRCALDVEKLRAQVQHTLARLEQRSLEEADRSPPSGSPTTEVSESGFFARVGRLIFGPPTRVTLRA